MIPTFIATTPMLHPPPPHSLEDRVMVDFQQKALDHFQEQKAKIEKTREEEEKKRKVKDLGNGKVEFTDSLGRTRVADKADVKDLMVCGLKLSEQ